MKFTAEINVMPLKALLDPQGKTVSASMKKLDLSEIDNVRIGKHITQTTAPASSMISVHITGPFIGKRRKPWVSWSVMVTTVGTVGSSVRGATTQSIAVVVHE